MRTLYTVHDTSDSSMCFPTHTLITFVSHGVFAVFKAASSKRALCRTGCGEFPRAAESTSQTPCSFHRHRLNPAPKHISAVTTFNQTSVHPPVSSCHILDVTSASAVRCRGVHQETCGGKITTHVLEGHITVGSLTRTPFMTF